MKTMTATDASRNFTSVLDRAEHGETIVITRGGRRLAILAPAPAPVGNGAALREFLAAHRVDDDYAEDVLSGRGGTTDELGTA
ncbi:type II toxin-antitoxin system Phd/YefM family antitoxin [Streptomyces ureilyticus]|uniref:Antitoxin n=1 Tax=Streptomyces ureilyticus TaxID=1775131 RepID=A0ABX0DN13_9ACTN|nr:type II toxin-antitoxin system prevent-host-death family antitoxin [Streptomyces ureilyticus]NGO43270.1 type II toxin-antitoxin system Phd/YefM family antitoxin [Streptomyces ureilyticus]